jgi:hypothetical protein
VFLSIQFRKFCSCCDVKITIVIVESSWNVMAHGDAREEKWRGNNRMEWVASKRHVTAEHRLARAVETLQADVHTSPASSRPNWHPRRFKRIRAFLQKDEIWFQRVCHHISDVVYHCGDPKYHPNSVVSVQDSLSELNQQLLRHPSILPVDFDITPCGDLVLNVPHAVERYDTGFERDYQNHEFDDQRVPVAKLSHSSSGDTSSPQVNC